MNGITFDAGGLIALERNDRRVFSILATALEAGDRIVIPATALAQVIRNPAKQVRLWRMIQHNETEVVPLEAALGVLANSQVDVLELNRSLDRLTGIDPQQARVVELRYFGGLSIEETAEVLGVSPATVKREWSTARLWLLQDMEGTAA